MDYGIEEVCDISSSPVIIESPTNEQSEQASIVHLVLRLRGGGHGPPPEPKNAEMTLAAGGAIRQSIVAVPQRQFRKTITIAFNVQLLNTASFSAVTGLAPPSTPASAAAYTRLGLPFYHLYEEPSLVSGGFSGLKSVAQIDGTPEKALENLSIIDVKTGEPVVDYNGGNGGAKKPRGDTAGPKLGRVGLLDPRGSRAELQFTWEIAAKHKAEHLAKMRIQQTVCLAVEEPMNFAE